MMRMVPTVVAEVKAAIVVGTETEMEVEIGNSRKYSKVAATVSALREVSM
jgi:hypothetical protein